MIQVKCPYCGYVMPIRIAPGAYSRGIWVRCKGRNCKKDFEIYIPNKKSVK